MDRRTLLFVIALTLALFGINIYFERQHQDSLKEWQAKNKAQNSQKIEQLHAEIVENSVREGDLALADLYQDADARIFLSTALLFNDNFLTIRQGKDFPDKVYGRKKGSIEDLVEFSRVVLPQEVSELALYKNESAPPIQIGSLPDFGTYYLQLISPATTPETPPTILLGKYVNGQLTVLAEQMEQLKQPPNQKAPQIATDAIVLMQSPNGLVPVGFYRAASKQIVYFDKLPAFQKFIKKEKQATVEETTEKSSQKYYVLENDYQQLVFTNFGGALAEINLPFQSDKDPNSVVKEIEFDRLMVENHPYNAYFPAHPFYAPGPDGPVEHEKGTLGGYYPLIRRDLIQSENKASVHVDPKYYALNIVSEYPEVAELVYEVKEFESNRIVFEAKQPHRRITKIYTVEHNDEKNAPYVINLKVKIEGDGRGLWLTSGVPEVEWISGAPAPALKYRITRNQKAEVVNLDLPQDALTVTSVTPDWVANSNGFLGIIQDATNKTDPGYRVQHVSGTAVPSRLIEIEEEYQRFLPQNLPGYITMLPLKATEGTTDFRIFAGPFSDSVLKIVDKTFSDPATGYTPDYIASQTFHGWFAFISEPFAKFLLILMRFFYSFTGSWAFSIVLLTVALRIMMYPLNAWSTKSMVRMQQIAPEVAAIQEKYKKDPRKGQIEIMNLYRERGVNPLSGCLPLLIQMPFLIGMFDLLKSNFELRGASFIPGWIDDLAAPDVLFRWQTPIFFIGNEFHLLPIILGVVMFLQQRMMSTAPSDPKLMTDQQRQQKAMGTMMSVLFTVMFYNFPSGLNIYWLSSMLLGILQQWWTTKKMQKMPPVAKAKAK